MSGELRCEFCGSTECLTTCDWPVMDFVVMRLRDLEVGDLVRRFGDLRKRGPARVVELQDFAEEGRRRVVLAIGERCKVFTDSIFAAIRIKRDCKCGRVCCERCRCWRGPGAEYCAEHWRLTEAAA